MKKTVSVTLNSVIFTLEEDAYNKLKEYLDGIKEYFANVDSAESTDEIINDIEASIAEKFSAKLNTKKQVINIRDVQELIKVMGTIKDIASEEGNGALDTKEPRRREKKHEPAQAKKLYRNPDDVIIAGVCSGLGTYFNIDPVIFRLVFFLSIFVGGAGVIAYLVLWLIMPVAKTSSQKLEMQGAPVTLKKLESLAKDKAKQIKQINGRGVKKVLRVPLDFLRAIFRALGTFLKKSGKGIAIFFGVIIIIGTVLATTAVGFVAATLAFNISSLVLPEVFPVIEIVGSTLYYLGLAAAFFVVFVPLMFILLIGASLAGRKNAFSVVLSSLLVGVWMIAIIVLGVVLIDTVPRVKAQADEIINTESITKDFQFEDVNSLRIGTNGQLAVTKGEEFKLIITGPESVINELRFSQSDGELKLLQSEPRAWCLICPDFPIEIEVVLPKLESLIVFRSLEAEVKGFKDQILRVNAGEAARVKIYADGGELVHYIAGTRGRIEVLGSPDSLKAVLEGAGRLTALELDASEVNIDSVLLSRVTLGGIAEKLSAELDGSARLSAFELVADTVEVKAVSHSRAEVYPTKSLDAVAQEHGRISYQGSPEVVNKKSTEGGVIETTKEFELERISPLLEGKARLEIE